MYAKFILRLHIITILGFIGFISYKIVNYLFNSPNSL